MNPPDEAAEPAYARVGIGVVQAADDPAGSTGIVAIFAADPR